jgi:hypothetical protein
MLLSTCLELVFCTANVVAATTPVINSMDAPVPLIAFCCYSLIGLSTASSFRNIEKKSAGLERTLLSIIEE